MGRHEQLRHRILNHPSASIIVRRLKNVNKLWRAAFGILDVFGAERIYALI